MVVNNSGLFVMADIIFSRCSCGMCANCLFNIVFIIISLNIRGVLNYYYCIRYTILMQLLLEFTLVFLIIVVLSAGLYFFITTSRLFTPLHPLRTYVTIGDHTFNAELADSLVRQARGLSGRPSLDNNEGMLFLFSSPSIHRFWMRGMQFPLDVLWIHDGVVVDITHSVQPPSVSGTIATMSPSTPATMVLEINAGIAQQYGIVVGDAITIRSIPPR